MPAKAVGEWHLGLVSWTKWLAWGNKRAKWLRRNPACREFWGASMAKEQELRSGGEVGASRTSRASMGGDLWTLREVIGLKTKNFFVWLFVEGCGRYAQTTFSRMELLVEIEVILKQLIVKSSCLKTGKFHISEQCARRDGAAFGWHISKKYWKRARLDGWSEADTLQNSWGKLSKEELNQRTSRLEATESLWEWGRGRYPERHWMWYSLNLWKLSGEKEVLRDSPDVHLDVRWSR